MGGVLNLLAPYEQSFAFDELEQDLQSVFIKAFNELYGEIVTDIHYYGMPQLGSPAVIERFTKQDGLAVLRRPSSSDEIMRVIYSNWKSLASKRGLAFLEFMLQMLWADQWKVRRLWHSTGMVDLYPTVATVEPIEDSFLTSRIMISMDNSVDFSEVSDLAPTLMRLVPANIVAQISSEMPLGDFDRFGVAMVMTAHMTANMFNYEPITDANAPPWSEWIILRKMQVTPSGGVIYKALKSNLVSMYEASVVKEMAPYILSKLNDATYRAHYGVLHANAVLTQGHIGYKWDTANQRIIANKLPEVPDYIEASRVFISRFRATTQGGNPFFIGYELFHQIIDRVGWVIDEQGVINEIIDAPETAFKSGVFYSTVSFRDAFNLNIQDQIENNPDLADATMGSVEIQSETDIQTVYIQHYTKPEVQPVEPPTEPVDPEAEPLPPAEPVIIQVPYQLLVTVDVVPNPDYNPTFEGGLAPLDSLSLDNMLNEIMVMRDEWGDTGAGEMLARAANYAYSEEPSGVANHLYLANLYYFSYEQIRDQLIINANGVHGPVHEESAEAYINQIANTVFEPDPANQIVKRSDLEVLFNQNQTPV